MKYYGKQFDQDKAAQQIFAFAMDARNMRNSKAPGQCKICGNELQVYYCEDGLFLVRCLNCQIAALTTAESPREAARKTLGI